MPKRTVRSNLAHAARILGKKGGPARDRKLTSGQKEDIASEGGKAKARKK